MVAILPDKEWSKLDMNNQEKIIEDKGNTSPSPPPRKKRQPAEVGYSGDSLTTPDRNPQDDPGKASGADNGDTGDGTFPADSKSRTHRKCDDKYFDKLNKLFRKDN